MAILAMSLTILLGSINSGVIYSGNSRDETIAVFLAQQKITELEREREMLAAGSEESGRFKDEFERFSWQYSITLDTSVADLAELSGLQFPFEPMLVEVSVTWRQGRLERSFVLQEMMFPTVMTSTSAKPVAPEIR